MLSLKRQVIDSKESLFGLLTILETLTSCSSAGLISAEENKRMDEISVLKEETFRLLDEIDPSGDFPFDNDPFRTQQHLKEQVFRGRLEQIRSRIALLQNTPG